MKTETTFKLTLLNARYLAFEHEGEYFILDRVPQNLFAYLFLPLNWLLPQRLYCISKDEYMKAVPKPIILDRGVALKIGIIIVCYAGLGLIVWQSIKQGNYFVGTNLTLLQGVFIVLATFVLACFFAFAQNRRTYQMLLDKIDLTDKKIIERRIFPILDKNLIKALARYLICLAIPFVCLVFQLFTRNWLMFAGISLFSFLMLLSNSFVYSYKGSYRFGKNQ